jgi:hypothetical protein
MFLTSVRAVAALWMVCVFSQSAVADVPVFDDIDEEEMKTIIEEFGSSFSHTSVSSASSLGKIFGIEAGIVVGLVKSEGVKAIVEDVSPGTDFDSVPHAALLAGVSLPFGLGAELSFIPDVEFADIELKRHGLAFKWTLTDAFLSGWPIDLAIKAHWGNSQLAFRQTSPDTEVTFEAEILGAGVIVSKDFLIVEPYAGFGLVKIDGKLSATASIFDAAFTTGTEGESDRTGVEYFVGVQANLLILRAAVEYGKILDNDKISAKIGLKF